MRRHPTVTFDTLRQLARSLPDVEESTTYGAPALKVHGKMFACLPSHRSAEPDSVVFRLPFESRDGMIAENPDAFYLKDHYVGYPCVLARLSQLDTDALADLLAAARRFVLATDRVTPRRGARARSGSRHAPARRRR